MVVGLKRLAREFKCVFIDTYAYLQDSRNAFDYMDSTFSGKSSMHPKEVMNLWIGDIIYNVLFPRSLKILHGQPEPTVLGVYDATTNPNGMQNGWNELSGYRKPAYWLDNGTVKLMGVLYGGTITTGTTLFKLPFTIGTATFLNVGTRGGGGVLLVSTDGTIKVEKLLPPDTGTQWISLEGASYKLNRNLATLP
ncbi:hypothetical protein [Peribacillus phoenicis]|uniref:hypothetical protein n=1 Tax=unclassified Peribacillus TaxID=2675266 RepID=UPI0039A3B9C4